MAKNQKIIKTDTVNGNIEDASVVICYGDIKGNVKNCQYVVLVDGAIKGNVDCENLHGYIRRKKDEAAD